MPHWGGRADHQRRRQHHPAEGQLLGAVVKTAALYADKTNADKLVLYNCLTFMISE